MYRQQYSLPLNRQNGQALALAVGLFAIAGVMFFLMFNSGRAVNEKINLVNAADSAAYSGAQIAARNLNFMAYTNRAMIANEVAIGHLFSYEVELQILGEVFDQGFNSGGQLGGMVSAIYAELFPFFTETAGAQAVQFLMSMSEWIAGMMIVLYDINNDKYSGFQDQAFADLVTPNAYTGRTLVDDAMLAVAQTYEAQPNAAIGINNSDTFTNFRNRLDEINQQIAAATSDRERARLEKERDRLQPVVDAFTVIETQNQEICRMILFANPKAPTAGQNQIQDAQRAALCDGLANGNRNVNPTAVEDNGLLIATIESTYLDPENLTGGIWINDRNVSDYNITAGGQSWGTGSRTGQTTIEFRNNQMNWFADNDSLDLNLGSQHSFQYSSDASSTIQSFANTMNWLNVMILQLFGLCNNSEIRCSDLRNARYDSVQRFAALNSDQETATVIAFLEQSNCSDGIGNDENGQPKAGWRNNMTALDNQRKYCNPEENVYSMAKAEIFYERPDCYGGSVACTNQSIGFDAPGNGQREQPNLFNPFWQVRLVQ